MPTGASPIATNPLQTDITTDLAWQEEQVDRLLGFEVLQSVLNARYQPMEAERLADKISLDKGVSYRIVQSIQNTINARR
jgi:hypothetical protein